jgi:hypothetical protein
MLCGFYFTKKFKCQLCEVFWVTSHKMSSSPQVGWRTESGEGRGPHKLALVIYLAVLGLELRAYTLSHSSPFLVMIFFHLGSCDIFAQAGFIYLFICLFFWVGLGFEFRASCLQSRHSITWATPPVHLEIGSLELFAWSSLKSPSSWSQPPKLGLQVWATGAPLWQDFLKIFSFFLY